LADEHRLRLLGPGQITAFVAHTAEDASAWADHYAFKVAEQEGQRFACWVKDPKARRSTSAANFGMRASEICKIPR
jgi:hypothetical protein